MKTSLSLPLCLLFASLLILGCQYSNDDFPFPMIPLDDLYSHPHLYCGGITVKGYVIDTGLRFPGRTNFYCIYKLYSAPHYQPGDQFLILVCHQKCRIKFLPGMIRDDFQDEESVEEIIVAGRWQNSNHFGKGYYLELYAMQLNR